MAASGSSHRNIFGILEDFLIKVASLDIFEVLIFNYKLKDEFHSGLSCDFIPIIDELLNEVQGLLADYKSKSRSLESKTRELCLFSSLDQNYNSNNVAENKKIDKGNSTVAAEQSVELIPTSVLREMPLFSPKSIIEDNIEVDTADSLWNSDSKSSDLLTSQIHLPDISNHSSTNDTCSSLQCLSCQKLFNTEGKLTSYTCKCCKEKLLKNASQGEHGFSDNVNTTKLSQEFPLDFRHSTEIRSLIEDALHMPKEESVRGGTKVDCKVISGHSAIIEVSEFDGCSKNLENGNSHIERKMTMKMGAEMITEENVIKGSSFSYTQELEDKSHDTNVKSVNYSEKSEMIIQKTNNIPNKTRKRLLYIPCDKNVSEKSQEALCNVVENKTVHLNEELSECALENTVIISSIRNTNGRENSHSQDKVKATKKKNKPKDKGELLKKELVKRVVEEAEAKENLNVKDASEDLNHLGAVKCFGSNISSFICCGDCFFVHKDWDSFDKHVCSSSNLKEIHKSGDEEDSDEVTGVSASGGKENKLEDSGKLREEISAIEKLSEVCQEDVKIEESESKISVRNDALGTKTTHKQSSVITDYETLSGIHRFVCSICLEEYRSLNRMMYHLPRCVTGPYKCELCPLEYASRRELNLHKKKSHRDAQSFFCDECGVKFKFRTSLQKHKVNRHERWAEKESYACSHCTLTFPKKIYLTNHCIKVHSLERKFLCQVCGKKFLNQNSLNSHLNYHTDEARNRFSCSQCSKTFLRKEKLLYHLRIHTGERPFACKSCGKTFISKAKLTEHLWRHGGKKRYSCPHCPKKYAGRWDLKLHVRKMHGKTLSSADGHSAETCSISAPESACVTPEAENKIVADSSDELHTAEVLVVEEVDNIAVAAGSNDSDGLVVQLASVSSLEQAVLPSGTLMTLASTMDDALPHTNLQSPQFIQLNPSSSSSSVPIHIQPKISTKIGDLSTSQSEENEP